MIPRAIAAVGLRWAMPVLARRRFDLTVEGTAPDGPAILAARHYHHLDDALAIDVALPRRPHFVVALDWVHTPLQRRLLETLAWLAGWPGVVRADRRPGSPYTPADARRALRHAATDVMALLHAGKVVVLFPEAYPTIDPEGSSKQTDDAFLPFRPGAIRLALLAERNGPAVPIIPTGLVYHQRAGRRRVTLRFGMPVVARRGDAAAQTRELEAAVRALSVPETVAPDAR